MGLTVHINDDSNSNLNLQAFDSFHTVIGLSFQLSVSKSDLLKGSEVQLED